MAKYAVDCTITLMVEVGEDDEPGSAQFKAYEEIARLYGDHCALEMYYSE